MSANLEIIEGEVCETCLFVIAYDDDGGDAEAAARSREGLTREYAAGWTVVVDGEDKGFCWHSCELCRNDLAGERYGVHYILDLDTPEGRYYLGETR